MTNSRLSLIFLAILYIAKIPAILITVTLHEYAKAAVSAAQGDPLPRQKHRLTLNPFRHIEPVGAFLMLVSGYGWGQPVQTSPIFYPNKRRGILLTHTLPPLFNAVLGMAAAVALALAKPAALSLNDVFVNTLLAPDQMFDLSTVRVTLTGAGFAALYCFAAHLAVLNIKMLLFNIIPIYPMDGAKVLGLFVKPSAVFGIQRYETIILFIVTAVAALGLLDLLLGPLIMAVTRVSTWFIGSVLANGL